MRPGAAGTDSAIDRAYRAARELLRI